jgi:hypothetical protein
LEGAAGDHLGHVTALSLYAFSSRSFGDWEQRPIFKTHLTEAVPLRTVEPPIDQDLLRNLAGLFASADDEIPLTQDHEGERPYRTGVEPTALQRQFDQFKDLRNAGLLEVRGQTDLYFAAMNGGTVALTSLGKYFWRLSRDGRL